MLRKIYQAVFLLFTSVLITNAQNTGAIKGKVLDKATGEPLPFANVVAEMNGQQVGGSQTDFDGNFTIKPLAPGKYNVKASFVGYTAAEITGILVSTDKITFQDLKMAPSTVTIGVVDVTEYTVPLIDKGNPSTQKTITQEEIEVAPTRDVKSIAATTAGVAQKDEGDDLNVRGSRSEATDFYVDGVRVRGGVKLPNSGIEQITVVTGGIPAQYGDNTGGLISITTRGPSKDFAGGIEYSTSELFDKYGYNLGAANLSGPIWTKKDANGLRTRTIAGFFISGEYQVEKDPDPSAVDLYKVKDDKYNEITENPLTPSPLGQGFVYSTDFLRATDLEKIKAKPNYDSKGYRFSGKISLLPFERVEFTLGGNYDKTTNHNGTGIVAGNVWNNLLMNSDNNAEVIETNWNAFGRITQRFGSGVSDKDKASSSIKNAYYSLQFDVSKVLRTRQDDRHKDKIFDYGYIGRFSQLKAPFIAAQPYINSNGDTVTGYTQLGFQDIQYSFDPQNVNPIMQNYVEEYYSFDSDVTNLGELLTNNSLGNGITPSPTYSMWSSPGSPSGTYQTDDQTQYRATISGSADIKNHAIMMGFEFEQRIERTYVIVPIGLWGQMRLLANQFNTQLDIDNPVFIGDTAFFPRAYNHTVQDPNDPTNTIPAPHNFYENIRDQLGLSYTDYVDIDSYDRSIYDLSLFTPDDLLNDGNNFINYFGYDYTGKILKSKPTFEDFFKKKDDGGNFTREVDAFRPIYMAGFIQDKFAVNDLIFNIGVRVDRFDANQKVLNDPFLLYPAFTAGELTIPDRPSNIGDDYVVYVSNVNSPDVSNIVGYRNGLVWYDKEGGVVDDPSILAQAAGGTIAPYLENTNLVNNGTQNPEFDPNASFKDYEPQITVMPRVAFSFPISDEALFYAHYDVLTQRPSGRLRNNPITFLYLPITQGALLANPSLEPEKTTDYEIGFSQKVSNSAAISISAFYRELRNQIQTQFLTYAYPVNYQTFGNIDFGTVKGLTFSYDLRRTGNVRLTASYTLQFADGTGSNDLTSNRLVNNGSPYLRAIFPFDFDQRHTIVASVDYRYGSGKEYNGPMLFGTQFLKNTGINFIFKVTSGTPYSRQRDVTTQAANIGLQQIASGFLKGSVNGSRLPWQNKIDVKLDHDIELKFGKNADKKKTASLNIYILAQNVLNAKNIINVYRYTGNPDDDGYLASSVGQSAAETQTEPDSYIDLYQVKVNNPDNYSLPRRIRLGVRLDF